MTSARRVRRLRSAIPVRRRDVKVPFYVLASAVAIGARAVTALINRHLRRKRSVTIRLPGASSTSAAFGYIMLSGVQANRWFFFTATAA